MRILLFVSMLIFLSGCALDARRVPNQPIFTDAERSERAVQFDKWYSESR